MTTVERKTDVKNGLLHLFLASLAVLLQIVWLYAFFIYIGHFYPWIDTLLRIFAFFLVVYIYNRPSNSAKKMPWMVLIAIFPLLGSLLFLLTGFNTYPKKMARRFQVIDQKLGPFVPEDQSACREIFLRHPEATGLSRYLSSYAGFPAYNDSTAAYYPDAAKALEALKEGLASAEHFIFMEYHAIEDDLAFASIHKILKEKAAAGLDVRLFYDDMGSIAFINKEFIRRMEADGIKCRAFNPVVPAINMFMNNRDHRKITVVDGSLAFTGGYNIANEYFGLTSPYGLWKDAGLAIRGNAVKTFTFLFLEMWNAVRDQDEDDQDLSIFFPDQAPLKTDCCLQPFGDSPLDDEMTGENIYMNMIGQAKEYIWFSSPYLVIPDEMVYALSLAARRGVDVRIIIPGIPDKKMVYQASKSYCLPLAKAGVRIYEFTPGYNHAKLCICDGKTAFCGTVNLDFRSFYYHFENGIVLYGGQALEDIHKDFLQLFDLCQENTGKFANKSFHLELWISIIRLLAPLF